MFYQRYFYTNFTNLCLTRRLHPLSSMFASHHFMKHTNVMNYKNLNTILYSPINYHKDHDIQLRIKDLYTYCINHRIQYYDQIFFIHDPVYAWNIMFYKQNIVNIHSINGEYENLC